MNDSDALPAWRQDLAASLHRNRSDATSRYVQLATVRSNGTPANRTVVFRGFDDAGAVLIVSDTRSDKFQELSQKPCAEIAWYFGKTREQYRLQCTVELLLPEGESRARCEPLWQSLSPAARAQYFWPAPGVPVDTADTTPALVNDKTPPWFLGLAASVTAVDYLSLRPTPQLRRRYRLENGLWSVSAVNP
ncbi:MAG: pyridoxamine 5'-phosphate oxidase family protein [Pseudomonadota bacterium]